MPQESSRTIALRRELVRTASSRRSARRLVIGASVGAFALGAAVTGAVSAAAVSELSSANSEATAAWVASFARPNSQILGSVQHIQATGPDILELGPEPAEATGLVIAGGCTVVGEVRVSLDSEFLMEFGCESGDGSAGTRSMVEGPDPHRLQIDVDAGATFDFWAAWVREPPLPTASAQQLREVEDGTVTRDEYVAAFNRFVGCMGAAGYDLSATPQTTTVFNYAVPSPAVSDGSDERCYATQFQQVDTGWQIANEDTSEGTRILRECLVANGLPSKQTTQEIVADLTAAGIAIASC